MEKPLKSIKVQVLKKYIVTWWIAYQSAGLSYSERAFLVKSEKWEHFILGTLYSDGNYFKLSEELKTGRQQPEF